MTLTSNANINKQLLATIKDPSLNSIKEYLHRLMKEIKSSNLDTNTNLLQQTTGGISNLLKDPTMHPKFKYNSHKIIMYLILLTDYDVYKEFENSIYPILRGNCLYNKGLPIRKRGEDFFKKSVYFTGSDVSANQKNQIKTYGIQFIVFCLQTVYMLDKWIPCDFQDDLKPSKYAIGLKNLINQGVQFPRQDQFMFYKTNQTDEIERVIREIQRQYQSLLDPHTGTSSSIADPRISVEHISNAIKKKASLDKSKNFGSQSNSNINFQNQQKLQEKIQQKKIENLPKNNMLVLQEQKKKLAKEIEIQRTFYQEELQKKRLAQSNVKIYEMKIKTLEEQIEKLREKVSSLESKNHLLAQSLQNNSKSSIHSNDKHKDKTIEDLQINNRNLMNRIKLLEEEIMNYHNQKKLATVNFQNSKQNISNQSSSYASVEIQKLKKQNRSLKTKLLTECSQSSEFNSKKSKAKAENSQKSESQKFLGYEEGKSCFEPFYSNSSSEIKIRLRKAILRQKQLLYRDKMLEIGCITKIEGINTIKLVIVFTNISEKPLLNFGVDFVSREDLSVRLVQNTKNYLEISGQTKSEISVTINQIDFRCLLCSVRFNIQSQVYKLALILPVSKLKLAQQLVYTPIKKQQKLKKIEKVFKCDRKILSSLHKFKEYFDQAILQVDRTMHETYSLKMQFMGVKFYIQCDQIQGQLRIAIKYYEDQDFVRAEKLLQQFTFLFAKN